jgi:hypothetical protein
VYTSVLMGDFLHVRMESTTAIPLPAPEASKHINPSPVSHTTLWLKLSTIAKLSANSVMSLVTRLSGWSTIPESITLVESSSGCMDAPYSN